MGYAARVSIGWVMFWKAVIVGLWGAFAGWWVTFRKRRQETLELRYNPRNGRYEAFDWAEVAERAVIYGRNMLYGFGIATWIFCAYVWLSDDRETFNAVFDFIAGL